MKRTAVLITVMAVLASCRKESSPPPPQVTEGSVSLSFYVAQAENNVAWFSAGQLKTYKIPTINMDQALQKDAAFAFFSDGVKYGLYSAATYPPQYGQAEWVNRPVTTFKKTSITQEEMYYIYGAYPEGLPANLIKNAYATGGAPLPIAVSPEEGEIYAFETTTPGGKITGLLQVLVVPLDRRSVLMKAWTVK